LDQIPILEFKKVDTYCANTALSIADRGYVLQTGSIVLADTARNLMCNQMMQEAYLGGADVCETPL